MLLRKTLLLAVLMTIASVAGSGVLDPAMEAQLTALASGEEASALVILQSQAPIAELSRALSSRNATRPERHATIIAALQEETATQEDLLRWLDGALRDGLISGYTTYWIMNAVVVRGSAGAIREIAAREDVGSVDPVPVVELIAPVGNPSGEGSLRENLVTPGQRAIRSDQVWYEYGITGAGRLVANIDTGVDGQHPALMDRWRGNNGAAWQECWLDLLSGTTTYPEDSGSHGTHVMGSITGLGIATGDTVGAAWGAQWIACNAVGQGGGGSFDSDIIEAFQWLADPDGDPATTYDVPDVVQNSWRINENFGGDYVDCDDRWWGVIDNCEAAGCVVTFSAGNEGPGPETIGSPPDRASSPVNVLAVGAVDATNFGWPYPIAGFSSRGPTGCDVAEELKTKPEVAAPGVDVYSSVPGGGYQGNGWSGTSMAGPHVAGVVALMREANPDLEVDVIKQILLDTARDEGDPGEDNDYGYGFIDAFAAVSIAIEGTGVLEGTVYNATGGNIPLEGAIISLSGSAAQYPTDANGIFHGRAVEGSYIAVASHPSFGTDSAAVVITVDQVTVQDFTLVDMVGPEITSVSEYVTIPDEIGPYTIEATLNDYSGVADAAVWYRINGGDWLPASMALLRDGVYSGGLPGQTAGSTVDYYIDAEDNGGNTSRFPADAPASYESFVVTFPALVDDAEADLGWSFGWLGDTATEGRWVREDPVGTWMGERPSQPEDDHTADPGHICFITGNGEPGGLPGDADVDGGCTSLVSIPFDFSDAAEVYINYYRFFGQFGLGDDSFRFQVSTNNGLSWTDLDVVEELANEWTHVLLELSNSIALVNNTRFRVVACDEGFDSTLEGAIDDISIEILPTVPAGIDDGADARALTFLDPARPNPVTSAASIRFRLATPGHATLDLFDAAGRRVRQLVDGELDAGTHDVTWDGRDDRGNRVSAGVYFYRLRAGAFERSSRLSLVD